MKKKIIDWAKVAENKEPCYFWQGKRPEYPNIGRLYEYKPEGHTYRDNIFSAGEFLGWFENCDLVIPDHNKKYTNHYWVGRDNFIRSLKAKKEMKIKVDKDLFIELQEIAQENNVFWRGESGISELNGNGEVLYFVYGDGVYCMRYAPKLNKEKFETIDILEYFPETDSFISDPKPGYRACENWEEFKPFADKWVIHTASGFARKLDCISFDIDVTDVFKAKILFKDFKLAEPINGSKVIGVKV